MQMSRLFLWLFDELQRDDVGNMLRDSLKTADEHEVPVVFKPTANLLLIYTKTKRSYLLRYIKY